MASETVRTLEWVEKNFSLCNHDPSLEFEIKFCDRFQGLVSENPADFRVGINAFLFNTLVENFRGLPDEYIEETETEAVQYLSSK
jgi:hypothetical protein